MRFLCKFTISRLFGPPFPKRFLFPPRHYNATNGEAHQTYHHPPSLTSYPLVGRGDITWNLVSPIPLTYIPSTSGCVHRKLRRSSPPCRLSLIFLLFLPLLLLLLHRSLRLHRSLHLNSQWLPPDRHGSVPCRRSVRLLLGDSGNNNNNNKASSA